MASPPGDGSVAKNFYQGFMDAAAAVKKTAFSAPSVGDHNFSSKERKNLDDTISNMPAAKTGSGETFKQAVRTTNRELDKKSLDLPPTAREQLEKNVSSVNSGDTGATYGHATEVAVFAAEAKDAIRAGDGRNAGAAVVGVLANTLGMVSAGNSEKIERTLGK